MKDKETDNHSRRLFIKRSTGAAFASTLGLGLISTRQAAYASGGGTIGNLFLVLVQAYVYSSGEGYEAQTKTLIHNYTHSGNSANQEANCDALARHLLLTVGMGSGLLSGFCISELADALSDALDAARDARDVPQHDDIEAEAEAQIEAGE